MLYFDHIVHYVKNPKDAAYQFRQLGFHAVEGGKHPYWGTYNYLCYLQNLKYVEWIGIENEDIARNSDHPFSQTLVKDASFGEGFSFVAIRTDELDFLAESLRRKGFRLRGPFEGSRKRKDGIVLKWRMLFFDENENMPIFFIEWGQEDEQRIIDLQRLNVILPTMDYRPDINYVGIAVHEMNDTIEKFESVFSVYRSTNHTLYDELFRGEYNEMIINGSHFRFYQLSENEAIAEILKNKGVKPFVIGINGNKRESIHHLYGGFYHFY
jgi:hypothetical protein